VKKEKKDIADEVQNFFEGASASEAEAALKKMKDRLKGKEKSELMSSIASSMRDLEISPEDVLAISLTMSVAAYAVDGKDISGTAKFFYNIPEIMAKYIHSMSADLRDAIVEGLKKEMGN
jgi:hypothetical protein